MNFISMNINKNVCRICLDPQVTLNWNEELFEFCGVTYKDCYYRYTQLDETDADPFSTMLCKKCSEELKNAHFLIKKALESLRILQQTYDADYLVDEEHKASSCTVIKEESEEFEICFIARSTETSNEHNDVKVSIDLETVAEPSNDIETYLNNMNNIQPSSLSEECLELKEDKLHNSKLNNYTNETSSILRRSKQKIRTDELGTKSQSSTPIQNRSRKYKRYMCTYCSLIVPDICKLRKHEETHDKNRERKEVCPHCGLKFYNKTSLKSHILTHKEHREKKYKCEFCDKAYFNRGALNVHRRIHLGLMTKCTLCPKEFCRQIDLDRHMAQHSIIPLSQVNKSKYVVHCKDCNTQIPSIRWQAHKASHKNEPQLKCKICNRDFFSRRNCTKHIKNIHNKTRDEYETYIHYYIDKSKSRISHLMLQQFETIQPIKTINSYIN